MYGQPEPSSTAPLRSDQWRQNELYLYGVDLFNHGFWWEAHTAWEALWKEAPQHHVTRLFLQGLIQVAAAQLKRLEGKGRGADKLAAKGIEKLREMSRRCRGRPYMGLDLARFAARAEAVLRSDESTGGPRLRIELA